MTDREKLFQALEGFGAGVFDWKPASLCKTREPISDETALLKQFEGAEDAWIESPSITVYRRKGGDWTIATGRDCGKVVDLSTLRILSAEATFDANKRSISVRHLHALSWSLTRISEDETGGEVIVRDENQISILPRTSIRRRLYHDIEKGGITSDRFMGFGEYTPS